MSVNVQLGHRQYNIQPYLDQTKQNKKWKNKNFFECRLYNLNILIISLYIYIYIFIFNNSTVEVVGSSPRTFQKSISFEFSLLCNFPAERILKTQFEDTNSKCWNTLCCIKYCSFYSVFYVFGVGFEGKSGFLDLKFWSFWLCWFEIRNGFCFDLDFN